MANRMLIAGAAVLLSAVRSFGKKYNNVMAQAHILLVSTLIHAVKHGDPSTLNAFYGLLATNDATAARFYIGRLTAIVGGWDGVEVVSKEQMAEYKAKGAFIEFTKGEFYIIPSEVHEDAIANRKYVEGLADTMLNGDGEAGIWRDFTDRNNLSEIKTVGDDEIKTKLANLIKEAKGDKKNTTTTVSPDIIEALVAAQAKIGAPVTVVGKLN